MNVAIIPARSGSQRIPGKNVKEFCGKPMLSYAIEAANNSKHIDKVVVSTDSDKIAELAVKSGAEVPFLRPSNLSDNITPIAPVMTHALNQPFFKDLEIDNVCCIFPCVPLLGNEMIDSIFEEFIESNSLYAYPVINYVHPIQRSMRMTKNNKMEFYFSEHEITRTQDLEELYHDAGQFYWGKRDAWVAGKKMHTDGIGVIINPNQVVDIDTEEDWKRAELFKKISMQ